MEPSLAADPYEEYARENPELAAQIQAAVDKGRAYLERGAVDEARKQFQRVLGLFPYVPAALNNLALLAYGEGDRDRAAAYLGQLLQFSPNEPTANALMTRYWVDVGAVPRAVPYAERAVRAVGELCGAEDSVDPSRVRRSLEFTCQALAMLEDDALLVRLYELAGSVDLLPISSVHMGIAHFNRGVPDTAIRLWRQALSVDEEMVPARIYLEMTEMMHEQQLLPFRLDHQLEVPQSEKGRSIWMVKVPALFVATAVVRLYRGNSEEAEEALSLLTSVTMPGIERILVSVGSDITRLPRLRLMAGLNLVAIGESEKARYVAESVPRPAPGDESEAYWCLLQGLAREAAGDIRGAAQMAEEGRESLDAWEEPLGDHPLRQMLASLAERTGQMAGSGVSDPVAVDEGPPQAAIAALRLPDADWLRRALQDSLSTSLDTVLMKREHEDVVELARRFGQQAPGRMESEALVRRLAMRMRSLYVDRIVGMLSPTARMVLDRIADHSEPVDLPQLYQWSDSAGVSSQFWTALEELYRSGVVDIGRMDVPSSLPLVPQKVGVAIPTDLLGRFRHGG